MGSKESESHVDWAGGQRATLAIVFTDAKDSTYLAEDLGDEVMNEIWEAHFAQSRQLITRHKGRSIKGLGDGDMAVFRNVEDALDYAIALHADPGHPVVKLRAGIHIGPVHVLDDDVRGRAVNFAARVGSAFRGTEICLSDQAKDHIDALRAPRHADLPWQPRNAELKGLNRENRLWLLDPAAPRVSPGKVIKGLPLPADTAKTLRRSADMRGEISRRPQNFELVDFLVRSDVAYDRRVDGQAAAVLAQLDFVPRFFISSQHARVEFELQRAYLVISNEGSGALSPSDALRLESTARHAYYIPLRHIPAGAVSLCIDPEPGRTGLGQSALPPTHGENELSEVAAASAEVDPTCLRAELRVPIDTDGIHLELNAAVAANVSEGEAKHIKAILHVAMGQGRVVNGQMRKLLTIRQRTRGE